LKSPNLLGFSTETSKEYLVTEHAVFSGKEVKNVLTNLAVILEFE
jgi:DNA-directed RNA polymerase subunit H (RpoH/RPB5)